MDLHLPNDRNDNSMTAQERNENNSNVMNSYNAVDSDNNEINMNETINHSRNNSLLQTKTPWLFGEHKNPTVVSTRFKQLLTHS